MLTTRMFLNVFFFFEVKRLMIFDRHVFHFIVYERITFMCMCDSQVSKRNNLLMNFKTFVSSVSSKTCIRFSRSDSRYVSPKSEYMFDIVKIDHFSVTKFVFQTKPRMQTLLLIETFQSNLVGTELKRRLTQFLFSVLNQQMDFFSNDPSAGTFSEFLYNSLCADSFFQTRFNWQNTKLKKVESN